MNILFPVTRHLKRLAGLPVALCLALIVTGCAGTRYDRSTGESIDDRAITSRVKSALGADSIYKYPDVKVTTFKGHVQLSGFADTKDQKSKAEELAKRAAGVKDVENDITVKP